MQNNCCFWKQDSSKIRYNLTFHSTISNALFTAELLLTLMLNYKRSSIKPDNRKEQDKGSILGGETNLKLVLTLGGSTKSSNVYLKCFSTYIKVIQIQFLLMSN